jgi:hypothetical protein
MSSRQQQNPPSKRNERLDEYLLGWHLCQLLKNLIEITNSSETIEEISGNKRSHAEMKKEGQEGTDV